VARSESERVLALTSEGRRAAFMNGDRLLAICQSTIRQTIGSKMFSVKTIAERPHRDIVLESPALPEER
jgi:hypothetical protein